MVKIKTGQKAPIFQAESYNAGAVDLAEMIGNMKIVLVFSRYFGCPICQLDLKELMDRLPEIEEKNAKLIYITQSGEEACKDMIEEEDISFPVIGAEKIPGTKHDYKIYDIYGLGRMSLSAVSKVPLKLRECKKAGIEHGEYEGYESQSPGQFVIDETGTIIHAKNDWLNIDKILEVL